MLALLVVRSWGLQLGAIIGRGVGRIASGIAERLAAKEGAQGFKSLGAAAKGFSKNILPEGFKQTKQFGYQHGQKVYEYMGKYFSRDIDGHNGGVWKVFEAVGGKPKKNRYC